MGRRVPLFLIAGILSVLSLVADVGVTVNGADVSAETGPGWIYSNPALTLTGTGPFVLGGTRTDGSVRVTVANNSTVVLSNLTLRAAGTSQCAFQISSGKTVNVLLEGDNELSSGSNYAGLQVADDASVRIGKNSTGFLMAQTAQSGGAAGIGGMRKKSGGNICIEGGVIHAKGGDSAAAIGGGFLSDGGKTIVISGGTVFAEANSNDSLGGDICGGTDGDEIFSAAVTITGGSVNTAHGLIVDSPTNALGAAVHCVTVTGLVANAAVELKNLAGYGCDGIFADDAGKAYLWLTNGVYAFQANGNAVGARVNGAPVTADVLGLQQPVGVCVNGDDIGFAQSGEGWSFDAAGRELTFTGAGSYVISGTNVLDSLVMSCEVQTALKFLSFDSQGLTIDGRSEITGGTVALEKSRGALTITGGSVKCSQFVMAPSNGVDRVWCATVGELPPHEPVTVTGLAGYCTEGIVADESGEIFLWLPNGDYIFSVNGNGMRAIIDDEDAEAIALPEVIPTGVTVNGIDAAYGYGIGWDYDEPQLTLTLPRSFVIAGTNETGAVAVSVRADARVTISNLVLTTSDGAPMSIEPACSAELVLTGENSFLSEDRAFPALHVPSGAGIVIQAGAPDGSLTAEGGRWAAGIGGGDSEDAGRIEIQSGTIAAVMGSRADVDVGGGADGAGAEVVIAGGSVKASLIDECPVNDRGESLSCVTVPGLVPGAAVTLSGIADYGTQGLVADAEGKLYLWLPDGEKTFNAGGRKYNATVNGRAVTAADAGPAEEESVSPTRLEIVAFSFADGIARIEISTDLNADDFAAWAETASFAIDFREELGGEVVSVLTPNRTGAVLTASAPESVCGFFTVRAWNQ